MLPTIDPANLFPAGLNVTVRERESGVDGNVSPFELEVLCKFVRMVDPEVVFELGTFDGRTTLNLAAQVRPSARVYTLDLPAAGLDGPQLSLDIEERKYIDKPASGTRFAGTPEAARIVQLYGDSAAFDFTAYFRKVDFLFIDASHAFGYVLSDSRLALRMIRPGGMILWHDYLPTLRSGWPGLVRAMHLLHKQDPAFAGLKHLAGTSLALLQVPSVVPTPRKPSWLQRQLETLTDQGLHARQVLRRLAKHALAPLTGRRSP